MLIVVRTITTVTWLFDILPELFDDLRVQVVFTLNGEGSAYEEGVAEAFWDTPWVWDLHARSRSKTLAGSDLLRDLRPASVRANRDTSRRLDAIARLVDREGAERSAGRSPVEARGGGGPPGDAEPPVDL